MIDLFLIPNIDYLTNTVQVDIVAKSDEPIRMVAMDFGFTWNPKHLTFIDSTNEFATVGNTLAGIPCPEENQGCEGGVLWDFYGVNESFPPADGTGYFMWLGPLGVPVIETEAILGTLVFQINAKVTTSVGIIDNIQITEAPFKTVIYGTEIPGYDATGSLVGCKLFFKPRASLTTE